MCLCGDVNARMGELQDFIEGVDDIPLRNCIDISCNEYGELFHSHLNASNMCVLNGRTGDNRQNGFTCISTKGKSVVDYAWVPHEQLHHWNSFRVLRMSTLIDMFEVHAPESIPDHSVLCWELRLPSTLLSKNSTLLIHRKDPLIQILNEKYHFSTHMKISQDRTHHISSL